MKHLKFLILAVVATLAIQKIVAVTLPTTSYTPFGTEQTYSGSISDEIGVRLPNSSFHQLGAWSDCESKSTFDECENCCNQEEIKCFDACGEDEQCMDDCEEKTKNCQDGCGRSLPLSAPLWFALLLPLVASALKPLLRRSKA